MVKFMNCWKSVHLTRDYGSFRILIISMFAMLFTFIFLYLSFSIIHPSATPHADHFAWFAAGLLLLSPVHKLLHVMPFWVSGKKVQIRVKRRSGLLPVLQFRYRQSMPRNLFILATLSPALVITILAISLSMAMPEYMHYFIIAAAANAGLCVTDFIFLSQFFRAPKHCYVQDFEGGYDILVNNQLKA